MAQRVKFGMYGPFQPLEAIYETASWAEEKGIDSYWLGDRLIAFPTPHVLEAWSALAALGTRTSRIELGMSVTDTFRRNPAVFAQTVTAIDHISGGRVIPGVGMGERINLEPFGVAMEKGRNLERLEEFVGLAKEYWKGDPVTFDGEFFKASGGIVQPPPVQQPHPPLWLAGNTRRSQGIVGRVGDGWLPAAKSPEMYAEDLKVIKEAAEKAGRDPEAITPGLFMYAVVNEDEDQAHAVAMEIGRAILVWWRDSLKRLDVRAGGDELSIVNFDGSPDTLKKWFAAGAEIPEADARQLINFGTADEVETRVEAYVEAGVRHFVIVSLDGLGDVERWRQTAAVFGERIAPSFR